MRRFTEKGERMFDNAVDVTSDRMMVEEYLRPPMLVKDIYISQKLDVERRRLAEMKYKYSISEKDNPLRLEMIEIIVRSNPKFGSIVLKLV